ncbi:MAG TPA: DUF222 domain-containing protein, partial [Spirochaetia bacterium]|nr:DUF222 domain-containing protein [Spirochaetia bacterium]
MEQVELLVAELANLSAHLDAATHRLLELIRQLDESGAWADQGAISCAHWLSWRLGWDSGTAREHVRVARALGRLPLIDAAMRTGALSYAKVRALTRVGTEQNESRLLHMALLATGSQLERLCRGYRSVAEREGQPWQREREVRKRLLENGMVQLTVVLHPDEADLVLRAVDRAREVRAEQDRAAKVEHEQAGQVERAEQAAAAAGAAPSTNAEPTSPPRSPLPPEASEVSAETQWPTRADGIVTVAESFLAGHAVTGNGGERFQVMVHLDQEALGADGSWSATLEDGTRVPAETLRRVACDCGLVAVGHDGEALNIGRRTRSIPPAIRRALMLRDKGCAFPGCTHTRFLHGHHIEHWLHGGQTSVRNLVMLCTFHHRLLHEGEWTITVDTDG